jgi:polysaccharide export outer membrane protein
MTAVAGLTLRILTLVSLGTDQASTAPRAPAYRVGPGDVLEVTVVGRPELARLPTVQPTGVIRLPRLPEIAVAGLTPSEIGSKLTELLARSEPARPVVTVTVKEYRSQFVWVRGEVNKPGRTAFKGGIRLLDVLLQAAGFTSRASGEVLVERREGTFADGGTVRRFRLPRTGPNADALAELETVLKGDDIVTVAAASYVTVTGAVVHPGRYPLEGETTVSAAVSSAGGPTRSGVRRVRVNRRDPVNGQVQVLQTDLKAIQKGQEPDLVLLPDDQIEVKARL